MAWNDIDVKFEDLIGKRFTAIVVNNDNDEIHFTLEGGKQLKMYHYQDCCESVVIEDVCGDLADIIDSPILQAEEATSDQRPEDLAKPEYEDDSQTWTFYKFATIKGSVTIRWWGSSNGYYSESVDFVEVNKDTEQ